MNRTVHTICSRQLQWCSVLERKQMISTFRTCSQPAMIFQRHHGRNVNGGLMQRDISSTCLFVCLFVCLLQQSNAPRCITLTQSALLSCDSTPSNLAKTYVCVRAKPCIITQTPLHTSAHISCVVTTTRRHQTKTMPKRISFLFNSMDK